MPDPQRRNLSILNEVYDKVNTKYEIQKRNKKTELSFVKWVSEKLLLTLEQEEYITQRYAPFLHTEGIHENYVILRDAKKNKLVEVRFQNNELQCSEDEGECCVHIHYTMALPELTGFFQRHEFLKRTRPIKEE